MNLDEKYDHLAELFYQDTGYIAPGKDVRNVTSIYEQRRMFWNIFLKGYIRGENERIQE